MTADTRTPEPAVTDRALLLWFGAIIALTVGFQLARLTQDRAVAWLAIDYAFRATVLAVLAVSPLRRLVFRWERVRVSLLPFLGWCLVLGAGSVLLIKIGPFVADYLPRWKAGDYPMAWGGLRLIDLTFGIALTAVHEELVFRRFARLAFRRLGDGALMIAATSAIFGLYHWWAGVPNVVLCVGYGALFMMVYRRIGVLWPVMVAHYLVDLWIFA